MSAQVTNLAWGAYTFPTGYDRTENTQHVKDLIKHGADFLVKSWNNDAQAFVAVLGNNSQDFNYYGPVEEYEIYVDRPAFYINAQNPGKGNFCHNPKNGLEVCVEVWIQILKLASDSKKCPKITIQEDWPGKYVSRV